MTPLTPEPRTDKNGKVTVRHVRTDKPSSASASRIPKPALSTPKGLPAAERRAIRDETVTALYGEVLTSVPRKHTAGFRKALLSYSDEDALLIRDTAKAYAPRLPSLLHRLLVPMTMKGHGARAARTIAVVGENTPSELQDDGNITSSLLGLMHHGLLEPDFSVPEGKEELARAHVQVTAAIADCVGLWSSAIKKGVTMDYSLTKGGEMTRLVEENADRTDSITRIIYARLTDDPGLIREILASDSPALMSGVL